MHSKKRIGMKLLFLIFFIKLVTSELIKEVCQYNHDNHNLYKANCSNFRIVSSIKTYLNQTTLGKLIFHNVTGTLNLNNMPLKKLTHLSVSQSKINSFHLGILQNLNFLILLNNEQFPNLTQNLFVRTNEKLNSLSLVGNNHSIEPNSFHFLKNLTWLHIQNQKFVHLTGQFLQKNTKLHELTITNCGLESIDADAFDNTPEMEMLSLNFNQITHFNKGTFKNLQKLKILEVHHNMFTNFNFEQFRGAKSVTILGLSTSFLKHIRDANVLMTTFPNLRQMEVKKRALKRHPQAKELIRQLRRKNIQIIGTPHDCHHLSTNTCLDII